jgi:hypothetical protein
MDFFQKIFGLPSIEKRDVPFWFANYMVGGNAARKKSDDTYVYYLIFRTSFYVALFFSLLNIVSQAINTPLNLYFFKIDLTGPDYVKTFLMTYPKYMATILLFCILPFYIAFFRYNINPIKFDIFWKNENPVPVATMKVWQVWLLCITGSAVLILAMYGAFGWLALYMQALNLANSHFYLLFSSIVLPLILALGNFGILQIAIVFWKYSWKHKYHDDQGF